MGLSHNLAIIYFLLASAISGCKSLAPISINTSRPQDEWVSFAKYQSLQYDPKLPVEQIQLAVNHSNRVAAGYLLTENSVDKLNLSDPIDANLWEILNRDGPNMRASRNFKDWTDVSLNVSKRAWFLMHEHAKKVVYDRVSLAQPAIEQLLIDARVSRECLKASRSVMNATSNLESWAIKMLNSWGNFPPIGLFDGTYSELGSYHSCLSVRNNDKIDHAHWCTLSYRPLLPNRGQFDLVVNKEHDDLIYLFDRPNLKGSSNRGSSKKRDAMSDLLEYAQYHRFLYYKWATCWPIACSPFDIRRVAKLLGRRNILSNGPVKCFSRFADDYEEPGSVEIIAPNQTVGANGTAVVQKKKLLISIWDLNHGIFIAKPFFDSTQKVAVAILLSISAFIFLMTFIDLAYNRVPQIYRLASTTLNYIPVDTKQDDICLEVNPSKGDTGHTQKIPSNDDDFETLPTSHQSGQSFEEQDRQPVVEVAKGAEKKSLFWSLVNDCSIVTNSRSFFTVSDGQMKNDILCLNGIRFIHMNWIILTHTMMYNDWSAFARTREIEKSLKSLVTQPIFNASYLVDTFFIMSGLLGAYTAFKHCQGIKSKFRSFSYIMGRWLRLTPQIFMTSLVFMIFPLLSHGPHYYPYVGEYAEHCVHHWWINVLHLQAFYKVEEMCNFVTWWISIDFFYHFFALAFIWVVLLRGHKTTLWSITVLVGCFVAMQSYKHYSFGLPPNVFSTIPQTGEMWSNMSLGLLWTPYSHAVPFFMGFYVGYLMAMKRELIERILNPRLALICWTLSGIFLVAQAYSTYWWVVGEAGYTQIGATLYHITVPILWSLTMCWVIVACHHGYGGFLNELLSAKVFIVMGKASYMVYLSHFQILFLFFGNQGVLLEPTELVMTYVVVGNNLMATFYGMFLCIVYEIPYLRLSRRLMS